MIRKKKLKDSDHDLIKNMNEIQKHRGPDDSGFFASEHVALGHRRLSILDLSEAGHQPMQYGERYTVVFNGEIYNYLEIREELREKGYRFHTQTDTEVIMAAYDFWGVGCFRYFNGMWAIALFDRERATLVLSRDRFGVKPLYYFRDSEHIVFASEIKALLQDGSIERVANDDAVYDYLSQGLLDHTDYTFFQNIYQFPKGTYALLTAALEINPVRFWKVEFNENIGNGFDRREEKNFRDKFMNAVSLRLRADVPVGSCLSGGLDSSAIVCGIDSINKKRKIRQKQYTFSYRADDAGLDEFQYMNAVISGTNVEAKFVTPKSADFMKEADSLIYHQDEPFSTTGMYAGYCVYREAKRNHVKVLLDGQGADELLCGYRKSRIYYIKRLIQDKKIRLACKELLLSLPQARMSLIFKSSRKSDWNKIKRILFGNRKAGNIPECYLNKAFLSATNGYGYDRSRNFQHNDVFRISLPALLRYTDRNSMAFSVESRLPFLDYLFVEECAGLPLSAKIRNGYSKAVMRAALRLPDAVRARKDKLGFATPEDKWVRNSGSELKKVFLNPGFRAGRFVDRKKILADWDRIICRNAIPYFFRIVCLEKWMQIFDVY